MMTKIPGKDNSEEEKLISAYNLRLSVHGWWTPLLWTQVRRQNIMAERCGGGALLCSPGQEVRGRVCREDEPSRACAQWPASSNHVLPAYPYHPVSPFKLGWAD